VTHYLLDTNIISNVTKPRPSEALVEWMADQSDRDLYIASLSLAEIRRGILQMAEGRKRGELQSWYDGAEGPRELFKGRILSFDATAAEVWGEFMAEGVRRRATRSALDMIIAATAEANDCTVVSDNERHFDGVVPLLNPMRG
jgi:predicted nucleic acid-binding protein